VPNPVRQATKRREQSSQVLARLQRPDRQEKTGRQAVIRQYRRARFDSDAFEPLFGHAVVNYRDAFRRYAVLLDDIGNHRGGYRDDRIRPTRGGTHDDILESAMLGRSPFRMAQRNRVVQGCNDRYTGKLRDPVVRCVICIDAMRQRLRPRESHLAEDRERAACPIAERKCISARIVRGQPRGALAVADDRMDLDVAHRVEPSPQLPRVHPDSVGPAF
jgi:hypothetical protein